MVKDLKLERGLMHTRFSSWRLQQLATVNRHKLYVTGHASATATTALDFLHTRAFVLRNHLLLSEGRLFVFTQSEYRPGYFVYELLAVPASDPGFLASQVAELGAEAGEETAGGAVEAVVDCSLAVVAEAPQPPGAAPLTSALTACSEHPMGTSPLPPPPPSPPPQQQLLLSRGHGDIVLMRRLGNHVSYSNPVYPLQPRLPLTGVRPLILEAAFAADNGDITAVVWAMRSKGPHLAACCEVFAVALRPVWERQQQQQQQQPPGGGGAPGVSGPPRPNSDNLHLSTVDVQLLLRTKLPPFVARVVRQPHPHPHPGEQEQPEFFEQPVGGAAGCDCKVSGSGDRHWMLVLGFDPSTAGLEEDDGVDATMDITMPSGGADSACGGGGGGDPMDDEGDDDDDVDPRTLEAAAARLAHMTSEEREGAQWGAQWADIYKESGLDGVGAMGHEPTMDLAAWRFRSGGSGGGAAGGQAGAVGRGQRIDKPLAPVWRLSCGAHRLLTAEGPVRTCQHHHQQQAHHQAAQHPQTQPPLLLLGVTDDVDCAVLRVDCSGAGRSAGPSGAVGERGGNGEGQLPEAVQVRHVVSIPALAYVAAGKTFKRHLLLSSTGAIDSGSNTSLAGVCGTSTTPLAAVLVESQCFMYMYGSTSTQEEYGKQQVVDLQLEDGETVLGARLVEVEEEGSASASANDVAAVDNPHPMVFVVVVTQRRLLSYRLEL